MLLDRRDRVIVKLLVLVSFITLTIQTSSLAWGQWQSLVEHAGDVVFAATGTKGEMIALSVVPIPGKCFCEPIGGVKTDPLLQIVFLAKVLYAERCFWVRKILQIYLGPSIITDILSFY